MAQSRLACASPTACCAWVSTPHDSCGERSACGACVDGCTGWVDSSTPTYQLYDLGADPYETTNLYQAEPEVVNRISKRLDEIAETMLPIEWKSSDTKAYTTWAQTGYITPWCSS